MSQIKTWKSFISVIQPKKPTDFKTREANCKYATASSGFRTHSCSTVIDTLNRHNGRRLFWKDLANTLRKKSRASWRRCFLPYHNSNLSFLLYLKAGVFLKLQIGTVLTKPVECLGQITNRGHRVCCIPADTSDAKQIWSYAARGHSYGLCNSGATGCTGVSYAGWVTVDGCELATVYVHDCLKTCFLCVSPAQLCSCFLELVSGEVGPSLSQQLHNILVPELVRGHAMKSYIYYCLYQLTL